MATITEVLEQVAALKESQTALDSKLDEVREFIKTLEVGTVTQGQLDQLSASLEELKTKSVDVLAEADALDAPAQD